MSDATTAAPSGSISGKYVIALLLVFGLAGVAGAGWYFMQSEKQARAWLTPTNAELVLKADRVTVMRLSEANPSEQARLSETLLVDTLPLAVVRREDVTEAPELVSLRRALIKDASFRWNAPPPMDCQPKWPFALRFTEERLDRSTTILLDFECQLARVHPFGATAVSIEPISDGLEQFFTEKLPLVKDPAASD